MMMAPAGVWSFGDKQDNGPLLKYCQRLPTQIHGHGDDKDEDDDDGFLYRNMWMPDGDDDFE